MVFRRNIYFTCFCFEFSLCYIQLAQEAEKKMYISQIHFGFTNLGSQVHSFWVIAVWIRKFWSWTPCMFKSFNTYSTLILTTFQPFKFYHQQLLSRTNRALLALMDLIVDLGQLQLLRQCISYQLSTLANFDSKLLFSSIKTFNA